MQLLIQRRQNVGPFGVKFFLATRLQLTDEEQNLVRTYNAREAIIFIGNVRRDIILSAVFALLLTVAFGVAGIALIAQNPAAFWRAATALGLTPGVVFSSVPIAFGVLWVILYRIVRETVRIGDLIGGRAFKCHSIMDIQEMEEFLKKVAFAIAQMLEDMKNWGGREIVPVAPLIERNYDTSIPKDAPPAPMSATAPLPGHLEKFTPQ